MLGYVHPPIASTSSLNATVASSSADAASTSMQDTSNDMDESTNRQAGPLPAKVGELGYTGEALTAPRTTDPGASTETLVGPHPTERERDQRDQQRQQSSTDARHQHQNSSASSTTSLPSTSRRDNNPNGQSSVSLAPTTSSFSSLKKRLKFLALSPKSKPYLLGCTPRTVFRLCVQLAILGGTITGWVLGVRSFNTALPQAPNPPANDSNPNDNNNSNIPVSGSIFIHVAFTVATLIQLLFLERCTFQLRAERHAYLHPNSPLPSHFHRRNGSSSRMPYAPWNRPSLPTYAAALGFRGTGDAEDNEIARVVAIGSGDVPPQYGNNRGSTLLAYGIGGRVRTSVSSQTTWQEVDREVGNGTSNDETRSGSPIPSRPVSYGQSEQIEDALRANQLEVALAKLESVGGRTS